MRSLFPASCRPARTLGAAAVAVVLVASAGASGAQADAPSASQIEQRLDASRQQLNSLYAQSAAASERLNGARLSLQVARADLVRQKATQKKAKAGLTEQRQQVAAMTVEGLQQASSARALASVLDGVDPTVLLQESTTRSSVDEAMTALLDGMDARQAVLDAATRTVEATVDDAEAAAQDQEAAQRAIDDAVAGAEDVKASAEAERGSLLRQLATARKTSVAEVTRDQEAVESRLDESGPRRPVDDVRDPEPRPTTSTPKPKPKPKPADPPAASGSKVEKAVAFAKAQLGEKYVWGGAGPSSWDCSGLTMRAWQAAGVNISHYAGSQYTQTKKVSVGNIRRGDLLFWSDGGPGSIYHVALYLGGGQMIHAPRPGRTVEIVPLSYWIQPDLASRPG